MSNLTFHKGPLSEVALHTPVSTYVSKPGYVGGLILQPRETGCIDYELHVDSPAEAAKLTTIASSFWEMRRHAVAHGVKRIAIKKTHPLCSKWSWKDLEKCLVESFRGTNIQIIVCEL
jgi:hypothetical protein